MMIGDGINDAPVLAGADVSVALDTGTDLAKNSADVILLSADLNKVFVLIEIGKKATRIIKQNFTWAIGYCYSFNKRKELLTTIKELKDMPITAI
jgi:Cu2+-exporting ATPase